MTRNDQLDPSGRHLALQGLAHWGVFILLIYALAWLNSLEQAGAGAIYAAASATFFIGLGLSHIIHEWGHFAGAAITRSRLTLKPKIHPLFFDFDYPVNTPRQFLVMSVGGLTGNLVLLSALLVYLGPHTHTLVSTSLLAAVCGQLVYVLVLELPVSWLVVKGQEPLAALTAHFGQGGPLFLRATIAGVSIAALVFWLR